MFEHLSDHEIGVLDLAREHITKALPSSGVPGELRAIIEKYRRPLECNSLFSLGITEVRCQRRPGHSERHNWRDSGDSTYIAWT